MSDFEAFCDAALFGELPKLRKLLAANPQFVRETDEEGFTALHLLMTEEQPEVAELLVNSGADVHAKNDIGMTPLHLAQYAEMVDILLRAGADINAVDNHGSTPLLLAAAESPRAGSVEVMEALLQAGADPTRKDGRGRTALDLATNREEDEKIALLKSFLTD